MTAATDLVHRVVDVLDRFGVPFMVKLRWKRRKDVDDVLGIIGVQGDRLDLPYIRQWTASHGTQSLFEQLSGQAVPPELK